jgi:hypothetical protein
MAKQSVCVKCENPKFEKVRAYLNTDISVSYVQCSECGGVVGILHDIDELLIKIKAIRRD